MSQLKAFRFGVFVAILSSCGPPLPPRVVEFPANAPEAVELIEGDAPDHFQRLAEISLHYYGDGAEEEALRRARIVAGELGADALAFRLIPVTRARRSARTQQRAALSVYESVPYLSARVNCSVARYTLNPEHNADSRRVGFSLDCYDSDPFAPPGSPDQADALDAGHDYVRGYALVGWALIRVAKLESDGKRSEP